MKNFENVLKIQQHTGPFWNLESACAHCLLQIEEIVCLFRLLQRN